MLSKTYFHQIFLIFLQVTAPISENETQMPSPNQLRYRIIIKNKKLRSANEFSNIGKAVLQRTTTMEEAADIDEEYDSDFGEDEFEEGKCSNY